MDASVIAIATVMLVARTLNVRKSTRECVSERGNITVNYSLAFTSDGAVKYVLQPKHTFFPNRPSPNPQ
jgi:hypothetical protein